VDQAPVVQHRQVEAAAVPGNDLGREFLDAVEEALDDLPFANLGRRQGPHLEGIPGPQGAGDGHHPLQVQGQEVAAVLGPALLEGQFGHLVVGEVGGKIVQAAQPGHIRDGFNIEDEDGNHGTQAGKTPVDR